MDDLDSRRVRAAKNQSLFREVNERIAALSRRYERELRPNSYVCECLDMSCIETIELPHAEYERLRQGDVRFFVVPGHEDPDVEETVESAERYLVVSKIGVGAEIAASLNPRREKELA